MSGPAGAGRGAAPAGAGRPGAPARLSVWAPEGVGEVVAGDDRAAVLGAALLAVADAEPDLRPVPGDIVVVGSKVVSKAEGRAVVATDREQAIAGQTVRVVATRVHADGSVLRIVENPLGLVMAAAGVDASNAPDSSVLLLPQDPDASARRLRAALTARLGVRLGVVITDTAGRPWREGLTDMAIGCAGVAPAEDLRGSVDAGGRPLTATVTAVADEIAAAAELVRGKAAGRPVAVVRGLGRYVTDDDGPGARVLVRRAEDDLFSMGTAEALARGRESGYSAGYRDGFEEARRETGNVPIVR